MTKGLRSIIPHEPEHTSHLVHEGMLELSQNYQQRSREQEPSVSKLHHALDQRTILDLTIEYVL